MIDRFKGEYRWLSNFWPARVRLDGIEFATTEHAYQAGKVLSPEIRERIRALPTPAAARRFGRQIGKVMPYRPAWNESFKVSLMRYLLWQKFADPILRKRLIATGDAALVEGGHWHDVFWGRSNCRNCAGSGANRLGRLLMEIRAECRTKEAGMAVPERRLADAA